MKEFRLIEYENFKEAFLDVFETSSSKKNFLEKEFY